MQIAHNLFAFIWTNPQANNCNTYLIKGSKNILIDPGHAQFFSFVRLGLMEAGLTPEQVDLVLITHAHPDHLEAVSLFRKPTLWALGEVEFAFLRQWLSRYGGGEALEPDFFLQEGTLLVGDHRLEVLWTPGHSPGSISYYFPEAKALFTGDVIFPLGLGRIDLPGGSGEQLKDSISRLSSLETEFLLSGHGGILKGKKAVVENFRRVEEEWFDFI